MSEPTGGTGRRRGRPAVKHSRERILDEAVAVAVEQGASAVTIRAVARRLGTSPMSLYRHVRSHGDLVGAVVDRLLEAEPPADPPPPELWEERLRWAGRYLLDLFDRYPAIRGLFTAGPVPSRRLLDVLEDVVDSLVRAGCTPDEAADIDFVLVTAVVGFAALLDEHRKMFRSGADRIAYLEEAMARLPRERYPRIFSIPERLRLFVDPSQYERNLELVVEAARVHVMRARAGGDDSPSVERVLAGMESALLDRLLAGDTAAVSELLADDFVITTAGWLSGPVDRTTWLAELNAQHRLTGYALTRVDVRPHGDTAVVLVESQQSGERNGEAWAMQFRYTDVWVLRAGTWLLAARHATGRPHVPG
jgi:AcrR family transcriptional regulator